MYKFTPLLFVVLIGSYALTSCRKVFDYIHDHPDAHDTVCHITRMTLLGLSGGRDTFVVLYNAKGDPTDILERTAVLNVDNIEHHFRYDKLGRLQYHFVNFSPQPGSGDPHTNIGFLYHKYDYPRKNFVTDTSIPYPSSYPPMYDSAEGDYINGYTLDEKGRIIKVWNVSPDPHMPPHLDHEVVYDANGNLPLSNPDLVYDDKINVYRTSRIFQFVFQEFSRNNPINTTVGATPVYNAFGLPLTLPKSDHYYGSLFGFANSGSSMNFEYACSLPKGPVNY